MESYMSILPLRASTQSLGSSSIEVSSIAYGFWRYTGTDVRTAQAKVETALGAGITLMDHADIYGADGEGSFGDAELLFGKVLKESPHLREQMVIATKGGIVLGLPYDSSATYIRTAVEASLSRMNIDVIDLYQIHRPDFLTHPQELAKILTELRESGKIKEVGVSNYTSTQFSALQAHLDFPIVSHQPEFSCWQHQALRDGILDQCMQNNVTALAWSPLAGGKLVMEAAQAQQEDTRLGAVIKELDTLAHKYEVSRSAVAIAWVMAHPAQIIPILGTQNLERIKACMEAYQVQFTRNQWNKVLEAAQGENLP
jgi:predicted oxidoreductase